MAHERRDNIWRLCQIPFYFLRNSNDKHHQNIHDADHLGRFIPKWNTNFWTTRVIFSTLLRNNINKFVMDEPQTKSRWWWAKNVAIYNAHKLLLVFSWMFTPLVNALDYVLVGTLKFLKMLQVVVCSRLGMISM